jgi:hypothetical protein
MSEPNKHQVMEEGGVGVGAKKSMGLSKYTQYYLSVLQQQEIPKTPQGKNLTQKNIIFLIFFSV